MEALATLFEKYVETFFIGFITAIPILMVLNGKNIAGKIYKVIGLESTSNNLQAIKTMLFVFFIFSFGLFFKSMTYWIFEGEHKKVILYTECKYRSIKKNLDKQKECDCLEGYEEYGFSFLPDLLSNDLDNEKNRSCLYLDHLSKQTRWYIFGRESYNAQIESIGRNITISQGLVFSSLLLILVSLIKLIHALIARTIKKKDVLKIGVYILCGIVLYGFSFRTWRALEERYHIRIYIAAQFLNKDKNTSK
jgi:hypothetical protein